MPSADRIVEQAQQNIYAQNAGKDTSPGAVPVFNYKQASFDSNKYNVKGLSYPEDLMSNASEHGDNTVIFYINSSVDSRVFKQGPEVVAYAVQRDMRGALVGQRITDAQALAGSTGTAAGAAALGGKVVGGSAIKGAAVGGAVGAGTAALISSQANNQESPAEAEKNVTFTRPQKQLQAAIALHIPNQIAARYSVGWGEEDTFALSAAAKGAEEISRSFNNDANKTRSGGISNLAKEIAANQALEKGPLGKDLGIAAGIAANPKKEQAFKNVDFRTFTFEYQFSPKSESEAQNALNIIRAFKYHMHPEFNSSNQFIYIYPSEFDIVYYKGGKENLNIHRHTSCVLTELNVNYSPNGVFSTFPNGMPTQISVTMTFKELMLLTKESIEKYT